MQADFSGIGVAGVTGPRRLLVPFRRLLQRLLLPVFQRQAELFGRLGQDVEGLRIQAGQLRVELRQTCDQLTEARVELCRVWKEQVRLSGRSIKQFLDAHDNVLVGNGGVGDAWLTVADWNRSRTGQVLFGATAALQEFVEKIFALFGIPALVVPAFQSTGEERELFEAVLRHPHCRSQGYQPAHLDYADWARRPEHYFQRVVRQLPVQEMFGAADNLRATQAMVALAPRGSEGGRSFEQRYLSVLEYRELVAKLLSLQATVVTIGSEDDLEYYGLFPHRNHIWMNSDWALSYPEPRYSINLEYLLRAINGCDAVISVDTWLKTYAAFAGIPTTVIRTRFSREFTNPSDGIFLHPAWGFRLADITELLRETGLVFAAAG